MTETRVPINEDERELLYTIYRTRLRVFCGGYAFLVGTGVYHFIAPYGRMTEEQLSTRIAKGESYEVFDHSMTHSDMFWVLLLFFGGLVFISGAIIFFRKVYPFRKDLRDGYKESLIYTIIRKSNFTTTGQYFFSFDDPNFPHYEVDEDMWYEAAEGDEIVIYRAVHSKYVFVHNGRYTLL